MEQELKEEMFNYLDELRNSGDTNMLGAAKYLQREFGVNANDARDTLLAWMRQA